MKIRLARPKDVPAIIFLMREFAEYEKLLDSFEITEEKLSNVLFGNDSFVQALVAEFEKHICAYAIFYPNFSTFRGQLGMYLEDIFILREFRRLAIGERMLRKIAGIAARRGFERIDFQVLDWNESAIGFYERLGAVCDDSDRHFKITDKAFAELAK